MAFTETNLMTFKPTYIKFGDVGTTAPATSIIGVVDDATMEEAEAESTAIGWLFGDAPLLETYTMGEFTFTFNIAKVDKEQIIALYGGEYDETTGEILRPVSAKTISKRLEIGFGEGFEKINIYNASISANWNFADMKTTPANLAITCKALVDTTDEDKPKSVGFQLRAEPVVP